MSKRLVWFIIIFFALAIISNNSEEQSIFSWFKNKASQPKLVEAKSMPSSSNNYVCQPNVNLESHFNIPYYINSNNRELKISNVDNVVCMNKQNTNSMYPSISEGNCMIVQSYEKFKTKDSLKVGRVIIYKRGYEMISHRIVSIKNDNKRVYYLTRGDNNKEIDNKPIYENQIVYVVVGEIYI